MAQDRIGIRRKRHLSFEITAETPKEAAFATFMEGLDGFTQDCFADGRELNVPPTEREAIRDSRKGERLQT